MTLDKTELILIRERSCLSLESFPISFKRNMTFLMLSLIHGIKGAKNVRSEYRNMEGKSRGVRE
jgi:hypothetical protein